MTGPGESILDYGSGKGLLKSGINGQRDVREYDPCIEGKDATPEPADLVVCTDVLEHIEPECTADVLKELRRLSLGCALFSIHLKPAKKFLADGRNAHINLKSPEWWVEQVEPLFWVRDKHISEYELILILLPRKLNA